MKLKGLLIGGAAGFTAALAVQKYFSQRPLSSEDALKRVKNQVRQALHIDGAWIYLTPQDYSKNGLSYNVFKGGLTAKEDGTIQHYDFVADADTGTIIDLNEQ